MSKKIFHDTPRGGGEGSVPVSPNDTMGRGSKIGQKSVTYYLNGPLKLELTFLGESEVN